MSDAGLAARRDEHARTCWMWDVGEWLVVRGERRERRCV